MRGQAEAIANNLREMAKLTVPVLVPVIGEGGSGGALAIGDRRSSPDAENAIYSVISPEVARQFFGRIPARRRAPQRNCVYRQDLKHEGMSIKVIDEQKVGRRFSDEAARLLDSVLSARLAESFNSSVEERLTRRYQKLRQLGKWETSDSNSAYFARLGTAIAVLRVFRNVNEAAER